MSTTILDSLKNVEFSLADSLRAGAWKSHIIYAQLQLDNAIILLEKDYPINTDIRPLLKLYGHPDLIPPYKKENK